jgi:Tripartite tricarboxylate transporter TctB family
VSFRGDFLSAAAWAAFGVVVVIASWRLDRLENLHINPWSAPGLTPGLVGLLIILLAGALALQARRRGRSPEAGRNDPSLAGSPDHPAEGDGAAGRNEERSAGELSRTLLASVICVLFAGVSLGHGLPFLVEGAAFIFLFIGVFSWRQWQAEGRVARALLTTLGIAFVAAGLISWLFESVFLVRLP